MQRSQTRTHWSIVIAGAGPTGLTLAGLLAKYGVDVLVMERNPQTVQEPRAVSIDDESLRTMQAVGVINQLLPNLVLGYGSKYFSARGRPFLKVKPTTQEYGYPRRNLFGSLSWRRFFATICSAMPMPRHGLPRSSSDSRSRIPAWHCRCARRRAPSNCHATI